MSQALRFTFDAPRFPSSLYPFTNLSIFPFRPTIFNLSSLFILYPFILSPYVADPYNKEAYEYTNRNRHVTNHVVRLRPHCYWIWTSGRKGCNPGSETRQTGRRHRTWGTARRVMHTLRNTPQQDAARSSAVYLQSRTTHVSRDSMCG